MDFDQARFNLRQSWLKAEYEYLEFINNEAYKKFMERMRERGTFCSVTDPSESNGCCTDDEDDGDGEEVNPECRLIYKKLSLKYHPDREGGDKVKFQMILKAYQENDLAKLMRFSAGDFDLDEDLEKKICSMKCTWYYQWYTGSKNDKEFIEKNFVTKEEKEKIKKEQKELADWLKKFSEQTKSQEERLREREKESNERIRVREEDCDKFIETRMKILDQREKEFKEWVEIKEKNSTERIERREKDSNEWIKKRQEDFTKRISKKEQECDEWIKKRQGNFSGWVQEREQECDDEFGRRMQKYDELVKRIEKQLGTKSEPAAFVSE